MHHTASGWGHAIVQTQKSLPDAIAKERLLDSSAMPTLPPGGAEERETVVEEDSYLNHPERDFAASKDPYGQLLAKPDCASHLLRYGIHSVPVGFDESVVCGYRR